MNRRRFLLTSAGVAAATFNGCARAATSEAPQRMLILIELRGGNDGLNTVVPIENGRYYDLRPRLALRGDAVVPLAPGAALHASLAPWLPLWKAGEMAVLQGVGYPQPDLSHFRSIEIWDTASPSNEIVQTGWLTRVADISVIFKAAPADGVILGAADLGPFSGGARAVALADAQRFSSQARLASGAERPASGALAHIVRVENDVVRAGAELASTRPLSTDFPRTPFGQAVRQAAMIAATRRVPVIRITQSGFDTHQNQPAVQANLLRQVADGVIALRAALQEARVWDDTVILTYSEFGRRPRENSSGGTDHGTAGVHFAFGPRVKGAIYGAPPALERLDVDGNPQYTLDFRAVYAAIISQWWKLDPQRALRGRFDAVPFLEA